MPLDYGAEVTPDKVRFVNYPATSLPPGTFKSMAELLPMGKRRVALRPIQVNQPLLAADLTGEGQDASIAALLPDGMRAASVRINDVSGVAGFVKPNDTVDVLITRQAIGADGATQQVTDVLLQNIRVIAMDQDASGRRRQARARQAPRRSKSTPVDAQKLALGQQLGQLSLVLRKPGDEQDIRMVETVSLDDLRYSYTAARRSCRGRCRRPPALRRRRRGVSARVARLRRAGARRSRASRRPTASRSLRGMNQQQI